MLQLLKDVRVLELTVAWAGPLAGKLVADLGGDVIHVEHMNARGTGIPAGISPTEGWEWGTLPEPISRSGVFPNADPGERPWNRQAIFNKHNRNKRSLCIDLKEPEARAIFLDLARQADIVLDNYSPRVMASLGIGYDDLVQVNPTVISISMSGYGHTGPFANRVSYGPILEAHSGLASISGADDAPMKLGAAFPDAVGGISGALAIAAALVHRDDTGEGQFIDLSQLETYCSLAGDAFLYQSLSGQPIDPVEWAKLQFGDLHGSFECEAGEWLAISAQTPAQRQILADLLGVPAESRDELGRAIVAWCAARTRASAIAELHSARIPAYPILSNGELLGDAHLAHRRMFVEHDQVDVGPISWPAFPVRTGDGDDLARYATAPALGGDNDDILRDLCGLDADAIDRLYAAGVIGKEPVLE